MLLGFLYLAVLARGGVECSAWNDTSQCMGTPTHHIGVNDTASCQSWCQLHLDEKGCCEVSEDFTETTNTTLKCTWFEGGKAQSNNQTQIPSVAANCRWSSNTCVKYEE